MKAVAARAARCLSLILPASLAVAACATPTQRIERIAAAAGLERRVVAGDRFDHVVFVKPAARPVDGFRVYVEGDGTPWITRHRPAADPTARRPLMLNLMALDPGPALYLGRPCYMGAKRGCRAEHWTGARYSQGVVRSMIAALDNAGRQLGWDGAATLVGHSGGGTLAMLMAPRAAAVSTVVTIAANLDVDAWARLHGYTPLAGSMDPADAAPLPARIRQIHLVGGEDEEVLPRITRAVAGRQRNAEVLYYPRHDHHCCWREEWRSILDRL